MNLFNRLSDTDKKLIDYYISEYASYNHAPIEDILKIWDEQKSVYLSQFFKDSFIITTPVEFKSGESDIEREIIETLYKDDECVKFQHLITEIIFPYSYEKSYIHPDNLSHRLISKVFAIDSLSNNKVKTNTYGSLANHTIPLPNGKTLKLNDGEKPLRFLGKIVKAFKLDTALFEHYCIVHSRCLNQKKLSGDLCISIHPLDYMTMSDNECDWSSCMSWYGDGEYKQGTVEMMNSPNVVVAYLKSSKNMEVGDGEWNSKKWRCLFIVDEDKIVSVKSYPYHNTYLTEAATREIYKLLGWDEKKTEINMFKPWKPFKIKGLTVNLDPCTGAMYNDFSSGATTHRIAINPNYDKTDLRGTLYYSGPSQCMCCGGTNGIGSDYGEQYLICDICESHRYCTECGCSMDEDEGYYYDGELYCNCCYNEYFFEDCISNEVLEHESYDEVQLYLTWDKNGEEHVKGYSGRHFWITTCDPIYNSTIYSKYFTDKFKYNEGSCEHYICVDNVTEKGLRELFYLSTPELEILKAQKET